MAKEFRCGDIIPGCSTVLEGKDEKKVMAKAAEHAENAHDMPTIPPEVAGKVQKAIRAHAARKVDHCAARKVSHLRVVHSTLFRSDRQRIGCGNVGISRAVRDFQAPVEIVL